MSLRNINQLIAVQAQKFPHHIAIKFGNDSLSYQTLTQKVNQFTNLLIAEFIHPGDKIGLAVTRSAEMVIALLAIMRAGATYVPLDPDFPVERLNFMLEDSEAKLLLTSKNFEPYFKPNVKRLFIEDILPTLAEYSVSEPDVKVSASHLAYILYTSGSTGKPKGVEIEHCNLSNFLLSMQKEPGLNHQDTLLAVTTISFDIAGLELYLPLICGARLIIADQETTRDGHLLLNVIETENVTVMQATPYTWRLMLASGWDNRIPLKVLCGGEAMPRDLADKLVIKCGSLWNLYGPTETTIWSSVKQIGQNDKIITIGHPIDNTQIYILNEGLQPVPQGEEGELFIGGDGVARGYFNRPELTAARFIPDHISARPGKKLYRTGDMGKITAGGEILCLGRIDNQVKLRGYRIETGEIEYNLIKIGRIKNAVVIVHNDVLGNQWLVAYVVTDGYLKPHKTSARFKAWSNALKKTLPDYMVPSDYIILPELPFTPNGKIDRNRLPRPEEHGIIRAYIAPETSLEVMITGVWTKYLGREKLGVNDNFFDLGGQSLIAVQIMTMIAKTTGKMLPIATLFNYPTVKKLATLIESGAEGTTWKSLVPIKPGGSKPPLYIIHGEGLNVLIFNSIAMNVDVEQPVYGLQAMGLNGLDKFPDSVEGIAAAYISEITEQNPIGPYAIAGYSLGGYIAIEMATQLKQMGKHVSLLAMLDANFKTPESQVPLLRLIVQKGLRQVYKGLFIISSFYKQPLKTLAYQRYITKLKLQKIGLLKETDPENVPGYMQKILDQLHTDIENYHMKAYDGVIHLFKSKVRIYYIDDFKYLGWKKYALKGITVHEVDGDHRDMLLPPNDKILARSLQKCLDGNC